MTLGARIAEHRQHRGESLQEVADAAGVSKTHIWDLEQGRTGNPSMQLVERLADHFGVTVAYLVGEDPKAKDANPVIARLFRQAEKLDDHGLALLDHMMQGLIEHHPKRAISRDEAC